MDRPLPQQMLVVQHTHAGSWRPRKRQLYNHLEDEHARWLAGGTYEEILAAHLELHQHQGG